MAKKTTKKPAKKKQLEFGPNQPDRYWLLFNKEGLVIDDPAETPEGVSKWADEPGDYIAAYYLDHDSIRKPVR